MMEARAAVEASHRLRDEMRMLRLQMNQSLSAVRESAATLAMSVGALGTVNGAAKFISSTAVGVLWTVVSPVFGFMLAAVLMAAGTLLLARMRTPKTAFESNGG